MTRLQKYFYFIVLLLGLAVDRIFKSVVLQTPHPAWGGLLQMHRNTGIAFSLALPPLAMAVGLAGALVIVVLALLREMKKPSPDLLPYLYILAGALSNIFDRMHYSAVIDYFTVPLVGLFFNFADVMIVGGILLLIFKRRDTIK